jgi:hypothetical protein
LQAQLQEALLRLPLDPNHSESNRDLLLPGIARQLALMVGNDQPPLSTRAAASNTTKRELKDVQKHANALLKTLEGLHEPAITALSDIGPLWPQGKLTLLLRVLIAAVDSAEIAETAPTAGRGRLPNLQATRIAEYLKQYFPLLTGKPATVSTRSEDGKAYGPFLDAVTEIFRILRIDASPETYARQVPNRRKKIAPRSVN